MQDSLLKKISDQLDKQDDKLEKQSEDITDIKLTQVRQEANLAEHMKRSDMLEKLYNELYKEVEEIKEPVSQLKGGVKLITILSGVIASILGILKFFGKL